MVSKKKQKNINVVRLPPVKLTKFSFFLSVFLSDSRQEEPPEWKAQEKQRHSDDSSWQVFDEN